MAKLSVILALVAVAATCCHAAKLDQIPLIRTPAQRNSARNFQPTPNLIGSYLPPSLDDPGCPDETTRTITLPPVTHTTTAPGRRPPGRTITVTVAGPTEFVENTQYATETVYRPGAEVTVTKTDFETVRVPSIPQTVVSTIITTSVNYRTTTSVDYKTITSTYATTEYRTQVVPTTLYSTVISTRTQQITNTRTMTRTQTVTQTQTRTLPAQTQYVTRTTTLPARTSTEFVTRTSTQVQTTTKYTTVLQTSYVTQVQTSTSVSVSTTTRVQPTTIYDTETQVDYRTNIVTSTVRGPGRTVTVSVTPSPPPVGRPSTVYVTETLTAPGRGPQITTAYQTTTVTTTVGGRPGRVSTVTVTPNCGQTTKAGYTYNAPAVPFHFEG